MIALQFLFLTALQSLLLTLVTLLSESLGESTLSGPVHTKQWSHTLWPQSERHFPMGVRLKYTSRNSLWSFISPSSSFPKCQFYYGNYHTVPYCIHFIWTHILLTSLRTENVILICIFHTHLPEALTRNFDITGLFISQQVFTSVLICPLSWAWFSTN